MKTTYLIYKQVDGTRQLVVATRKEWDEILKQNRGLPMEQRRLFERSCFTNGNELDCMYIEVDMPDFRAWEVKKKREYRNRKEEKRYEHLSFDAEIESSECVSLHECIASSETADQPLFDKTLLQNLEKELSAWKPWAVELLHLYMKGKRRSSTAWLASYCGVSDQMARRYKKEFETFVKKFFE